MAKRKAQPAAGGADAARWESVIAQVLRQSSEVAGLRRFVVGMSGGLDSAVVAGLAARAFGAAAVACVAMPDVDSDPQDLRHAEQACAAFGLDLAVRPIGLALAALSEGQDLRDKAVRGNAKARLRMLTLYAEAQRQGAMVLGTGNKSEILTGYFTKFGDGGADLLPIGDLYKTQVRELARHIGVPAAIIAKPPSAGLHPGQTDEADMGLSYPELDAVLRELELNLAVPDVVRRSGVGAAKVRRVAAMVRRSEHKRHLPLIPKLGVRTVGVDWRRSTQWQGEG